MSFPDPAMRRREEVRRKREESEERKWNKCVR